MILRLLKSLNNSLNFILTNVIAFAGIQKLPEQCISTGMVAQACRPSDLRQVFMFRKDLDGNKFSGLFRLHLRLFSANCCVEITDGQGALAAISCFYFNERDRSDTLVDEGLIGQRTDCSVKRLATAVRQFSFDHFASIGSLCGISSRITLSNTASVASGGKAGYELLETYKDKVTGEERGYFFNRFHHEVRE